MSHGPEEHLEQAHHAQHARLDPFDRRVAMSMAIVAGVLACVTMFSHRQHNQTLRFQSEANILQTRASDQWSFYQAKKQRQHQYETNAVLLDLVAKDSANAKAGARAGETQKEWNANRERYGKEAEEIKGEAEKLENESKEHQLESTHSHHVADRLDLGELGVEIALILCSVAVLTKDAKFWLGGIVFAVAGAVAAISCVFLQH